MSTFSANRLYHCRDPQWNAVIYYHAGAFLYGHAWRRRTGQVSHLSRDVEWDLDGNAAPGDPYLDLVDNSRPVSSHTTEIQFLLGEIASKLARVRMLIAEDASRGEG